MLLLLPSKEAELSSHRCLGQRYLSRRAVQAVRAVIIFDAQRNSMLLQEWMGVVVAQMIKMKPRLAKGQANPKHKNGPCIWR
jgi:hypothetical protein